MDEKFYFIDGIQPDHASKRLMRRHVMKGKNAGKTFHRPSRLARQETRRQPRTNQAANPSSTSYNLNQGRNRTDRRGIPTTPAPAVDRSFGDAFLAFSLPVEVTQDSLKVINEFFALTTERLYPVQLGISLHDAKLMWLRVLFADEATYRCSMSLMEACNEIFLGDGDSSPKALYHLAQTFSQVNRRLDSNDALSDPTIAIVVSLINQEQIKRQYSVAEIHVKGLARMVQLRGGLGAFAGNLPLMLKICKTDIMFALQYGGPTIFFRDRMSESRIILAANGLNLDHTLSTSYAHHEQLDSYLYEILLDITSLCSLFNKTLGNRTIDLMTFQEIVMSLCYRLLRFRGLNDARQTSGIQAAYHIGLTIFMMTIFLQFDHRRIMHYTYIPLRLKEVLTGAMEQRENEFVLWLMIVGGIWVSGDESSDWLLPKIRIVALQLGFNTWDEVRNSICKFPWLNALHDQPGRKLWEQVYY